MIGAAAVVPEGEDVMATGHSAAVPHDAVGGNLFVTVVRGYHKGQVEERLAQLQERIGQLQERISALEAELDSARRAPPAAAGDAVDMPSPSQSHPRNEGVSLRMAQILRLADEEAHEARSEAAEHAAALLERAQSEARDLLEAARATAEEVLRAAMRRSEEELATARAEAARVVDAAREQAHGVTPDAGDSPHPAPAETDVG